jgi:hypothetical protein
MQHAQPSRMLTERTQHMIDDGLPGGFLPHLDFDDLQSVGLLRSVF